MIGNISVSVHFPYISQKNLAFREFNFQQLGKRTAAFSNVIEVILEHVYRCTEVFPWIMMILIAYFNLRHEWIVFHSGEIL